MGVRLGPRRRRAAPLGLALAVLAPAGEAAAQRTVTAATVEHAGPTGEFTSVTMSDEDGDSVFTASVPAYSGLPRFRFTYTLTESSTEDEEEDVGTTPTTLFINELMAANDTTLADPQGDYDDWIELYNSGSEAIDMSGMYLSDDADEPTKWRFPAGTTITAGGFLLVWADGDTGDTPGLHANFRLSSGGESVVLSDVDERGNAVIDRVDFPELEDDEAYGRSTDGGEAFEVVPTPSPGATAPPRPDPTISIEAGHPAVEGGAATFTVSARPAPEADLTVLVTVTQGTGQDFLPASPPTSVVVTADATEAPLTVTLPEDTVDEANGVLTATLGAGAGYAVGSPASASLAVRDNDGGPAAARVAINELMAANDETIADPQGDYDDWVELFNTTSQAIDLAGWYLSDDPDEPKKWQFPAGTTIIAGGYLLVWADEDTDDTPGLHADFKLSAGGESVVLTGSDAGGNVVLDRVAFPELEDDEAHGRLPNGAGAFRKVAATPGAENAAVAVSIKAGRPAVEGGVATFTVSARPAPEADLTVTVTVTQGAGQDFLPASPPTSVVVAAGAAEATLTVTLPEDTTDEDNGVVTATLGAGAGYGPGSPASASLAVRDNDGGPAAARVAINELMASNQATIADPQNDYEDWIELFNNTSQPIELAGWYLSDDPDKPRKWKFPAGTTIAAGGHLLVWADEDTDDTPGLHADFQLSAGGESVVLTDTDARGNTVIDRVDYPRLEFDEAHGRLPNGSGAFQRVAASPGSANLGPSLLTLTASVANGTVAENAGAVTVTATLDRPAGIAGVTVTLLAGAASTATAADYTLPSAFTIAEGATSATADVTIVNDRIDDDDEDLALIASAGNLAVNGVTLTIVDDDTAGVTLSRSSLLVDEGSSADYTVVLESAPTGTVTVTPSVPVDRNLSVSPASFAFTAGNWQNTQTFTVTAARDTNTTSEPAVTISHQVSGADYGSVAVGSVTVTIVEADSSVLSVAAASAAEGAGALRFEVRLNKASASEITVDYATSDESARAGTDYEAARGTLTFPASSTASRQIVVSVTDDDVDEEEEETFRLTLSNARHASLAGGGSTLQVLGTIRDDDDPEAAVSFGAPSYGITEGGSASVVVRLDRDPERNLEIFLERTHHGGTEDGDYSGVPSSVAFGPGVRRRQFTVAATDDRIDDDGESVVLSFVSLPFRVTGDGEATIAITDNDGSGAGGSGAGGSGATGGGGGGGGTGGGGGGGTGVDSPPDDVDGDSGGGTGGGGGSPPDDDGGDSGGTGSNGSPPSGPPKAHFTPAECSADLCRSRTGATVTFEDTSSGRVVSRLWSFGDGRTSRSRRVVHAWSSPGFYEVTLSASDGTTTSIASEIFRVEASDPAGTCAPDSLTRCLLDSRYSATMEWRRPYGEGGRGVVVPVGTNDSAVFQFFGGDNWEVLIKVLDGCEVNGHVWVFGASTTDLGYVIRVTDTVTGLVKEYRNEPGLPAPAITDLTAFPVCGS